MSRPFDDTTRRKIAGLCAGFVRLPASEPMPALKRAAVAITLVEAAAAGGGTALLMTLPPISVPSLAMLARSFRPRLLTVVAVSVVLFGLLAGGLAVALGF